MIKSPQTLLTADDYREMPAGPPYFQLIEGRVYMAPSPDFAHQDIIGNLYFLLRRYLERHPVGKLILSLSDVELDRVNVHQPDLYFIRNERRAILRRQGPRGAPDLVIEVLSRSTERLDRGAKRIVYARSGVAELWLIDPDQEAVTVYRFAESVNEPVLVLRGRRSVTTPLLPGLRLALKDIFPGEEPVG